MSNGTSTVVAGPHGPLRVVFQEASHEQRVQCCKLAASAFGSPLSEADYLEREEFLGQQSLTANGGWKFWCLYYAGEEESVLATCKTMRRPLLLRDAERCHEEQGYCVTSVVTHPEYRCCGLASLLLGYVAEWMNGPSMLFTSIGDVILQATRILAPQTDEAPVLCQKRVGETSCSPVYFVIPSTSATFVETLCPPPRDPTFEQRRHSSALRAGRA